MFKAYIYLLFSLLTWGSSKTQPVQNLLTERENYPAVTAEPPAVNSGHHAGKNKQCEQEIQSLEALLKKQQRTFTWITACFLVLLAMTAVWVGRLIKLRRKQAPNKIALITKAAQGQDVPVTEQMKIYDQLILQMLTARTEYEEIRCKLKNDFGLDDKDYPPLDRGTA